MTKGKLSLVDLKALESVLYYYKYMMISVVMYYDDYDGIGRHKWTALGQGGRCGRAPHLVHPKKISWLFLIIGLYAVVWLYRLINIFR